MTQTFGGMGSTVSVTKLTEYLRLAAQDLQGFAQLASAPTGAALGKNKGDTVSFTYFPDMTTSGGVLSENEEIPEGSIVPISGSYVLQEYGNSIKWTGKLEDLAELDVENAFVQALINDMRKAQNTAAYTEFASTYWLATFNSTANEFVTSGSTASFTNAADRDLSLANMRYLVRQARKRLIPYFDGESYALVTGVDSSDAVRYDSTITTALSYDSARAALNGEVGRIGQCRIIEDTHKVAKVGGTGSVAATADACFLIGADAVINEYALAPEVRAQDKDFGRSIGTAWYFIGAWKKIYSQSLHSKEHVIKVASK